MADVPGNAEPTADAINLMPEVRRKRDGTGETRRTLSWIWLVERRDGAVEGLGNEENDNILQAEWAKSRAQSNRAMEEVKMLREEMRCLIESLDLEARVWSEQQSARMVTDSAIAQGLVAYAVKQAAIQHQLCTSFQALFKTPLQQIEVTMEGDGVEGGRG